MLERRLIKKYSYYAFWILEMASVKLTSARRVSTNLDEKLLEAIGITKITVSYIAVEMFFVCVVCLFWFCLPEKNIRE